MELGLWERGPEGVGESRFGDISQTPLGGAGKLLYGWAQTPRSCCDLGSLRWDLV